MAPPENHVLPVAEEEDGNDDDNESYDSSKNTLVTSPWMRKTHRIRFPLRASRTSHPKRSNLKEKTSRIRSMRNATAVPCATKRRCGPVGSAMTNSTVAWTT
ncbi:uncharacterized protein LOC117648109 [Thrips palmi]|uniref:Uncharacterized protein LOC117648109 n=1 Tax=Thrips palmi TaxID=161013 RepID=A0A6P8Z7U9_THRPL|nr:uncharacterized protein LOC117648109 [Thrips palmi]